MASALQIRFTQAFTSLFLLFALLSPLWAAPANYLLDVKTSDDDLPDSSVTAIAQTPDGYLWIGTYNGLARFDGVRFVTFDPVTTPALKSARVTGLFVDAWGTLWISTYDGSMTSLRNGVFTNEWRDGQVLGVYSKTNQLFFTLGGHHTKIICREEFGDKHGEWKEVLLAGGPTGNSFAQDGAGTLWYTVNRAVYRLQGTNSEPLGPSSGWPGSRVNSMSVDGAGHLWIGTDRGIARWNDDRFEDQTPTNGMPNVNVYALFCTTNGCWVFGDGQVRKCIDRQWVAEIDTKEWRDLVGTFQLELNAYKDRDGGLWFAHLGSGLFHIGADGSTEHLSAENGLPSNLAACWFQDREGSIWVGLTRGGLVHLRKREFRSIGPSPGLTGQAVSSICEDAQSNIWIGTFSSGLYRCRAENIERFDLPAGAYKECFFSIYPDGDNRLWLSAGREDLYAFENDRLVPSKLVAHGIKCMLVDKSERAWFGKLAGLSCLTNGVLKNFPTTNGLLNIRALAEDIAGDIWVGTGDGNLFRYHDGEFTHYQTSDGQEKRAIWSLLPQSDRTLWIGTFRGGLLRFKGGKFTRYTTHEGLPSDIIPQILDDRRGNLWIGSHKGIFSVSKNSFGELDVGNIRSLPCVTYGLSDGLPTLECSGNYQPACWRDHEGRLWFATVKGPVSVSPRELSINHTAPPVVVESILVNGKSYVLRSERAVKVQPGERQLEFQFTALSFVAPDKVAFRHKLEGFDEDWINDGPKRFAQYGVLPPGKYRFRVLACNNDGVWNEAGTAMTLVLEPHFWQTWWFELLVAMGVLSVVFGTVRFIVTRKLHRKLEKLQQQQALQHERERIAKDIHDDLGSGLTSILLQSALAQRNRLEETPAHLERISATATDLVGAMDEIVWAIDPENDTLDAVVTYAGKFVQEFVTQAGLRCRLDLPAQIPPVIISSQERHNLFLALKEVLNNAVKHARATEISFGLHLRSSGFSFVVKDNGCGFSPDKPPAHSDERSRISSGHGLRNLAERLEKIGGQCIVRSEPGQGTEVELTVTIKEKNLPSPKRSGG